VVGEGGIAGSSPLGHPHPITPSTISAIEISRRAGSPAVGKEPKTQLFPDGGLEARPEGYEEDGNPERGPPSPVHGRIIETPRLPAVFLYGMSRKLYELAGIQEIRREIYIEIPPSYTTCPSAASESGLGAVRTEWISERSPHPGLESAAERLRERNPI
jgi:hypothetical protein